MSIGINFLYLFIKIKPCAQNLTSLRHQKELIRRAYSCILHDKLPEGIGLQFPYRHKTTTRFGNKIRFGRRNVREVKWGNFYALVK